MDYDKLKVLLEMREKGDITEEEYQREKAKLMAEGDSGSANKNVTQKPFLGLDENNYIMLMHLSQLAGWVVPLLGYILPIIMWVSNRENSEMVDLHGKNIMNFTISFLIYFIVAGLLVILLIGIPALIVLGVLWLIYVIIATVKAASGEYWKYPLSIQFIK